MRITQRISTSFWAPLAFGLVAALYFMYQVNLTHSRFAELVDREIPVQLAISDLRFGVVRIVASTAEFGFILAETSAAMTEWDEGEPSTEFNRDSEGEEQELNELGTELVFNTLNTLEGHVSGHVDSEKHVPQIKMALTEVIALSGELIAAKQAGSAGAEILELKEAFEEAEQNALNHLDELAVIETAWFNERIAANEQLLESLVYELGIILFLGIFLSNTVRLTLTRKVNEPLSNLIEKVTKIRSGASFAEVNEGRPYSQDEFGDLSRSLDELLENNEALLAKYRAEKEHAEEANRSKSEFLANMSHELRTPMHAIISYSEMGAKRTLEPESEKLNKYFNRSLSSASRLLGLLNDLLDLSKLEAKQMVFRFAPVDVHHLIQVSGDELHGLLEEKSLQLRIESDLPQARVDADSDKLHQVIVNLISNAIKFSDRDGEIVTSIKARNLCQIEGRTAEPALEISVSDAGQGIPEGEVELIFEKFQQSSRTKSKAGGTGLGLAICREIVNGHGGRIWAENNAGAGATVRFVIPLAQPSAQGAD